MNKAESERLASYLEQLGYQATTTTEEADLILLNSCVVRQHAEDRVINKLDALKPLKRTSPGITLAVTGCLVNSQHDELKKSFPYVDHFFKPGECPQWLNKGKESPVVLPHDPSPSTFVPIIQGCNNYCSYCIVSYRRGRERSRPIDEVTSEVKELVSHGAREVTLLGQNVDSYGNDLPGKADLATLLEELNTINRLERIRFLTNHPKDMSPRLIDAVARLDKVCEKITLPVQSGDNDILQAMRRGYSVEDYRRLVNKIRSKIAGVNLSTDIIVGFPSESDRQFQKTYDLLSELRFDTVHVATYSPRPGTIASRKYTDNIPPNEKKERFHRIEQLQESIAEGINAKLVGKTVEVLVEGRGKGKWHGRTRSDKLVFFSNDNDCLGKLIPISIKHTTPWSLQGRVEI
jgi:tRNA-2-methylthio-N6-dimethylallyladenosine synthase